MLNNTFIRLRNYKNLISINSFPCSLLPLICIDKFSIRNFGWTMSRSEECFKGQLNRHNAVVVNSMEEPCESTLFSQRLKASLEEWTKLKRDAVWFEVSTKEADWIPILIKADFKFHHAKDDKLTLYRWLYSDATCNIPPYAHTNIGIGAFVYNENTAEVLVIKEMRAVNTMWKLPGGYMESNEDINKAIEREIFEETGIQATFKCLLGFRHTHEHVFGCSDIYMIAHLTPTTFDVKKCPQEISECVWMKLEEYAQHPEVHENNKFAAKKMIEHLKTGVGIEAMPAIHPITKKPIVVYTINNNTNL